MASERLCRKADKYPDLAQLFPHSRDSFSLWGNITFN